MARFSMGWPMMSALSSRTSNEGISVEAFEESVAPASRATMVSAMLSAARSVP